ncbi:MAG: NnrS family protein [Candidatus Sericytochromatia bacterium]
MENAIKNSIRSRPFADRAIWALGFRPFFLLGALAGSGLLGLWLYVLSGHALAGISPLWHAHEMLFGFSTAVLAGFLLTATQNWSGIRGLHGARLIALAGLWLAGRLAMLTPWPGLALVDLLFLPALMLGLWPYLSGPQQKRNRVMLVFFALLSAANGLYHAEMLLGLAWARQGLYLALDVFLMLISLIGGRIIPAFTRNAVPDARIDSWPWLEKTGFALMGAWLLAELFAQGQAWTRWLALAAAAAQLLRWLGWHPWQTRREPILWILPLGYAWLIFGLLLRGLPPALAPALPAATHALTAGAMGVLMYAMLTRVGLGHTGRPIKASILMLTGYALINAAAALRVLVPWLLPALSAQGMLVAGLCWSLAFGLYLWEYTPYLSQPRPDGKPG